MAKKKTSRRSSGNGRASASAAGKHLVIVESPTKARTINRYLGPDYQVMASVGHVRDLPSKSPKGEKQPVPGVDLDNDFEPTYEVMQGKNKTVTELKRAANKAEDVWFATDLDREGEAIAWHLAEALGIDVDNAKRVVFNAITRGEIQRAFEHPHRIDEAKVNAQQARRILDRIVGYQVSPLLWKKVAGGLSAGRVQSVATRLVVEREREIEGFVPDEQWSITGYFALDRDAAATLAPQWRDFMAERDDKGNPPTRKAQNAWLTERGLVRGELVEFAGEKFEPRVEADRVVGKLDEITPERIRERLKKAAEVFADASAHDLTPLVQRAAEGCGLTKTRVETEENPDGRGPARWGRRVEGEVDHEKPANRVESIETRRSKSNPAPPFITSTLQQQASNRLSFPATRTMRIAQQLYEGVDLGGSRGATGLITYMRTDSTHLSGDALGAVRRYIGDEFGDAYLPEKARSYSSSNRQAQEAHEAIRPTDVTITPREARHALSDEQYKLYDLIWRRFVACQMNPAQWDATTVTIAAGDAGGDPIARFRASGRTLAFDGHLKVMGVPTDDELVLPSLDENQPLAAMDIAPAQRFTSPPPRYTEASLIKKLETEGIGRPSTYASIIGTIQDREYVVPVGPRDPRLMATDLGKVVTDMLVEAFPEVMEVAYTREMEAELDQIEDEKHDWRKMLREFYGPFREALEQAHEHLQHAKATAEPAPFKCPRCGSPTEYRLGRNGKFLSCTQFSPPPVEVEVEAEPGKWLLYKGKGKARPKIVSPDGKRKVGWTKLTAAEKKRFQQISDEMPQCDYAAPIDKQGKPIEAEVSDILCPECGGRTTKRVGRFGAFLGCENYPTCKGIVKLDPKKGTVVLPKAPPLTTDVPCPKCDAPLYMRDSKRGFWLSCSRFPKCRGRVGWTKLEEEKQQELEKAWQAHSRENPTPKLYHVDGREVQEGETPVYEAQEESPASSDAA